MDFNMSNPNSLNDTISNPATCKLETQQAVNWLPTLREGIGKTWSFLGTPVLLLATIFAALLLLAPEQANRSAIFTLEAVLNILPFILLSVGIAAALKASGADQLVARAFAGRPAKAIALAAIFGAISPFCSCGVIPLVAGLLAAGVPIAPVLAFCIASPIMDPEMFVITAAGLGLEFALVKTVAAIVMGLFTGYVTLLISKTTALDGSLKNIAKPSCAAAKCSNKAVETQAGMAILAAGGSVADLLE